MQDNDSNQSSKAVDEIQSTVTRRKFFGKLGKATVAAAAVGALGAAPFVGGRESTAEAGNGNSDANGRMNDCFNYRKAISFLK